MDSRAKLAIIINCYNYEEYVGRAIDSVLAQSCTDYELFVVDDGSTDRSWDVIRQFGVRASRIENVGQLHACVFGLDQTAAPFVLFLDADDELAPGALEAILPRLHPDVAKLQFCLTRIDAQGKSTGSTLPARDAVINLGDLRDRVLKTGVYDSPPTSGNVFRRDVCDLLRDAGYDDAVDGVTILAAPFYGDIVSLPEEHGRYRVHDRNMSGVGKNLSRERLRQHLKRFEDRIDHLKTAIRDKSREAASLDCRRTFFHAEKTFILAVIDRDPARFRLLARLVGVTFRDYFPLTKKTLLSAVFTLAACLPPGPAARLISIRYRPEQRAPAAMLRALMRQG
jgi:glycosyltransferase involved in cell wall biosynthesis